MVIFCLQWADMEAKPDDAKPTSHSVMEGVSFTARPLRPLRFVYTYTSFGTIVIVGSSGSNGDGGSMHWCTKFHA